MSTICRESFLTQHHIHENGNCYQAQTENAQLIADAWQESEKNYRYLRVAVGVTVAAGLVFTGYAALWHPSSVVLTSIGVGGVAGVGYIIYGESVDFLGERRDGILARLKQEISGFSKQKWCSPALTDRVRGFLGI